MIELPIDGCRSEGPRESALTLLRILSNMAPSKLSIKTNAVKRLIKEKEFYSLELKEQEEILQSMTINQPDEYETKKQNDVVAETKSMLPELDKKIQLHKKDLSNYLSDYNGDESTEFARSLLASSP